MVYNAILISQSFTFVSNIESRYKTTYAQISKLTVFFSDVFLCLDRLGAVPTEDCRSLRSEILMVLLSFIAEDAPISDAIKVVGTGDRSGPTMLIFLVFNPDNK